MECLGSDSSFPMETMSSSENQPCSSLPFINLVAFLPKSILTKSRQRSANEKIHLLILCLTWLFSCFIIKPQEGR